MKRLALSLSIAATVVLIAACGAASPLYRSPGGAPAALPPMVATPAPAATVVAGGNLLGADKSLQPSLDAATSERMVVYNGSIQLEVSDTEAVVNKIDALLKANQGYISDRSLGRSDKGLWRGTITIRVPAASLDSVLQQIKGFALKTLHEDSKSQDVTQEYTDLDARRKNLEAYEVELTQLLSTVRERTGKAEDILAVYNQLTEVRGQIEQIKGRQNYLQNTSALATYTIELVPHEEITVVEEGWNPGSTARAALHDLVQALQAIGDVSITLALLVVPLLIVLAIPFIIIVWLARRLVKRPVGAPKAAA